MADNKALRFVDYLSALSTITVGGVSSYDIFNAWMSSENIESKDYYSRLLMFKSFVEWADENFYTFNKWDAEIFTKWADHLKDIGNKDYSIKIKLSNIRQVLLAAQAEGIIPKVIYFQRRGRKQRNPETHLVVLPKQPVIKPNRKVTHPKSDKFDRSFLYSLFGLSEGFTSDELKQAFKRVAFQYHPDRNQSKNAYKQFLACREAYSYLSDYENRAQYDSFIRQKKGRPNQTVMGFVSDMFNIFSA